MIFNRAKIQRTVVAASVMLASMFVLWWGIWMVAASEYRSFIDRWIEAHRAQGYTVTYDNRVTHGFPRAVSLHFTNFVLQNTDGIKIHAQDVSLSAFPWQWQRLRGKLKHGFELTIPLSDRKTLLITTDLAVRNRTELDSRGEWHFVNLEILNARAQWGGEPFFSADKFAIAIERPLAAPKDYTQPGLVLAGSADNMTLPPGMDGPFGAHVESLVASMRVMGPPPDPRKKDAVGAWNGAGGAVDMDQFFLKWGPLVFNAKGTLALDDDLQPEGVFSSQIGNHEAVVKTLLDNDYIPRNQAGMLNSALRLLAKQSDINGHSGIEVPITVQLGGLFLGP
ncbi:MAG: DUF2125 domain-containing protein, partial [Bdellovibrionales bacterium]